MLLELDGDDEDDDDNCCAHDFCMKFEDDFFASAFFKEDTVFSVVVVALETFSLLEFLFDPVLFRFFILGMAPVARKTDEVDALLESLLLAFGLIRGPAEAALDSRSLELFGDTVLKRGTYFNCLKMKWHKF